MKLLFLSRYSYPYVGGVEKHIDLLSKALIRKGYKIKVISRNDIKYPEVKILGLVYIWFWLFKNINIIKKCDVVHCHDVFIWYLPFRFVFPFKKVFTTFHGYESYPIKFRAKIIRKISEKLSNGNICIGKFMQKWYGTKPTAVSYGAVDIKRIKKAKVKYDAVFSGRFDEQTGIQTYLKAFKILKKKSNFKFLALGDGKYMNDVKGVATTPGWVKNPEKYLGQSRFAFADRYLAILEAFANKKLVFATYDNSVKKDYLYMTPYKDWIVIAKDPKELAEKIIFYKKNKSEAKEKIQSAYDWVKNQTWSSMANLYINLWENKL